MSLGPAPRWCPPIPPRRSPEEARKKMNRSNALAGVMGGLWLLLSLTAAAELRLVYRADNLPDTYSPPLGVELLVTPGTTTISEGERRLLIDYDGIRVVSWSDVQAPPQEYPLFPPLADGESPHGLADGVAAAIARYERTDDGHGGLIAGWRTREHTLYFGADLAPAQVAGPFAVKRYGRTFRERRVHVRTTHDHPHATALRQIAAQRQPLVAANPFLLQLDWVNLIPVLDGVPVALLERGHNLTVRLILEPEATDFYRPAPDG